MSKVRQDMEPEAHQNPQLLSLGRTEQAGGVGVPQTKGFQNFLNCTSCLHKTSST